MEQTNARKISHSAPAFSLPIVEKASRHFAVNKTEAGKQENPQGNPDLQAQPENLQSVGYHFANIPLTSARETFAPLPISPLSPSFLQRFGEKSPGILTRVQVDIAKNWYAGKRQRYTPAIIEQIQSQVGATKTGKIDDETVQAVAKYQQANPPLAVDGIAGPRTLPAAFPSGLAEAKSVTQYVAEAKKVQADWATLATPEARADALLKAVNARLSAAGVPICNQALKDLGPAAGQLDFTTWTLELGKQAFSKATLTDDEAAAIANTVYHEARHAEQWYRMAQLLAGQKKSAKAIATEMQIPPAVAATAFSNPLKQGSREALIAQGWYDSVYGARAAYRGQVIKEVLASKTAFEKAEETYNKSPIKANEAKRDAARKRFDVAYAKYVDLPEEADAHRVGAAVTAAYLAPAPSP